MFRATSAFQGEAWVRIPPGSPLPRRRRMQKPTIEYVRPLAALEVRGLLQAAATLAGPRRICDTRHHDATQPAPSTRSHFC